MLLPKSLRDRVWVLAAMGMLFGCETRMVGGGWGEWQQASNQRRQFKADERVEWEEPEEETQDQAGQDGVSERRTVTPEQRRSREGGGIAAAAVGGYVPGSTPEFDMANLSRQVQYTLLVASYSYADPAASQKAAEDRVQVLREEGHEAYYFHTKQTSIVGIGAFGDDALVQHNGPNGIVSFSESAQVRSARSRFPTMETQGATGGEGGAADQRSLLYRLRDPWLSP